MFPECSLSSPKTKVFLPKRRILEAETPGFSDVFFACKSILDSLTILEPFKKWWYTILIFYNPLVLLQQGITNNIIIHFSVQVFLLGNFFFTDHSFQ